MNTDRIYAEQIANEYAPKDTSKVIALRKLDAKAIGFSLSAPETIKGYPEGSVETMEKAISNCASV